MKRTKGSVPGSGADKGGGRKKDDPKRRAPSSSSAGSPVQQPSKRSRTTGQAPQEEVPPQVGQQGAATFAGPSAANPVGVQPQLQMGQQPPNLGYDNYGQIVQGASQYPAQRAQAGYPDSAFDQQQGYIASGQQLQLGYDIQPNQPAAQPRFYPMDAPAMGFPPFEEDYRDLQISAYVDPAQHYDQIQQAQGFNPNQSEYYDNPVIADPAPQAFDMSVGRAPGFNASAFHIDSSPQRLPEHTRVKVMQLIQEAQQAEQEKEEEEQRARRDRSCIPCAKRRIPCGKEKPHCSECLRLGKNCTYPRGGDKYSDIFRKD